MAGRRDAVHSRWKCPYCGQSLEGLPLIAAYRSLFSDAYNQLKADIAALRATVEQDFGDKATGALTTQAATNRPPWNSGGVIAPSRRTAWRCRQGLVPAISGLKDAVLDLLDRKAQAPLEAIDLAIDSGFLQRRGSVRPGERP